MQIKKVKYEIINSKMHVQDNAYGNIVLSEVMTEFLMTKEMQRLQNIKQNGYNCIDTPGLTQSRYEHSIGVGYLGTLWVDDRVQELKNFGITVDDKEAELVKLAFAGHDVGHIYGSHQTEKVLNYSHEDRTVEIFLANTEVRQFIRK